MDLLQNYPVAFLHSFSAGSAAQLTDVYLLEPPAGPQKGVQPLTGITTFDKNVTLGKFKIMVKLQVFHAGGRWGKKF